MNNPSEKLIAVDQLHQAAYLYLENTPIYRIERSGRFGVFYFNASNALPLIDLYMAGGARVDPRKFASTMRELRRLIDRALEQPNGILELPAPGVRP